MTDVRTMRYRQILKSIDRRSIYCFEETSAMIYRKHLDSLDSTFLSVTSHVTAPVLTSFVMWILSDAQKQGIENLLFMARDGFVMCKIAKALCDIWELRIKCSYFSVSRRSLRSSMFIIDKEYAMEKLFDANFQNAPVSAILAAAGLNEAQATEVLDGIGLDKDYRLDAREFWAAKYKLENNSKFNEYATKAAAKALVGVEKYFDKNAPESFSIVDSGWSGSIQECFQKLLSHLAKLQKNIVKGYYFGTLVNPAPGTDEYHSYYFSPQKSFRRFICFSIDLFENMCAADHGMVRGYDSIGEPILAELISCKGLAWNAGQQIMICTEYARNFAKTNMSVTSKAIQAPDSNSIEPLIRLFMERPTQEEARVFGAIPFSRDVIENQVSVLARKMTKEEFRMCSFFYRAFGQILRRRTQKYRKQSGTVYWMSGALVLSEASILRRIDLWLLNFAYFLKIKLFKRRG